MFQKKNYHGEMIFDVKKKTFLEITKCLFLIRNVI